MKIKFLRDFGGRETQEHHFPPGWEMELDDNIAEDLITRGIVEPIDQKEIEPDKETIDPAIKVVDQEVKRPTVPATKKGRKGHAKN